MSVAEILQEDLRPELRIVKSAPETGADFLSPPRERRSIKSVDFNLERSSLVLSLERSGLAESLVDPGELNRLQDHGFQVADQPHITILNFSSGDNILKALEKYSQSGQGIILRSIEKIAQRQDWNWTPTGEVHPFVGKNRSKLKMIAMVECPAVANFYKELEELIPGVEIERYPMHITLMGKKINAKEPVETSVGRLDLGRPLNTLGHLALGYEHVARELVEEPDEQMPWYVREALLKHFRIEPSEWLVFSNEELELGQDFKELGVPLPKDVIERAATDMGHIDTLGAAALGRRLALVPESVEHFWPHVGIMNVPDLSPLDRAKIFDEAMENSLEALQNPEITSQRVITGAVVKLASLLKNERLMEEAARRVDLYPNFYQPRLKSLGVFKQLGDSMLRQFMNERDAQQSLQTEVEPLQLAS